MSETLAERFKRISKEKEDAAFEKEKQRVCAILEEEMNIGANKVKINFYTDKWELSSDCYINVMNRVLEWLTNEGFYVDSDKIKEFIFI